MSVIWETEARILPVVPSQSGLQCETFQNTKNIGIFFQCGNGFFNIICKKVSIEIIKQCTEQYFSNYSWWLTKGY